ncbi:MAG: RNA binding S1 domain protein [Parcubacteria group bacterium GW2011_GWC1_41_7]|nr:MAG: RNA binding S1 domain protein [Parcubacteria group bacterium GW2011_GWC1_41_7]
MINRKPAQNQKSEFLRLPKNIIIGSLINGTVLKKRRGEMFVDLLHYGVGRIYGREYQACKKLIDRVREGEEVVAKILGVDDGFGNYEIVLHDVQEINKWAKISECIKNKTILRLPVLEANRGGLIVEVEGVRGFVPVSQLTPQHYPRVQGDDKNLILATLKQLVAQELSLRIISSDPASGKLILSERLGMSESYHEELKKYSEGQIISGRIVGVSAFGLFIRFQDNPPLEGLVHISEIPEKMQDIEERFKIGDEAQVKIIKIDSDRVNLSIKDLSEDPWVTFEKSHNQGDALQGTVVENNQDIFVIIEVERGIRGIVFENIQELEVGSTHTFKIIEINPTEKKLILSYEK